MKRIGKILKRALGTIAILALYHVAPDRIISDRVHDVAPAAIHRYSNQSETAVVFFSGIQSNAETMSAALQALWGQYGDVIIVNYNEVRFDGNATSYAVYRALVGWKYTRAILIGASMGGLVATGVIDHDYMADKHLEYAVMLVDSPRGKEDLKRPNTADVVARLVYPGIIGNLLTPVAWHFAFDPPPSYMLGEGVSNEQLAAHYAASRTVKLSTWSDRLRYITRHEGFLRNQYAGIPLIAMESEHDDTVRPTGRHWVTIFGGGKVVAVPDASHIDFVEHPLQWRAAFEKGFATLEAW